jgi:tetratricopeptide (TPR) repeat protein
MNFSVMTSLSQPLRIAFLACAVAITHLPLARAAEPTRIVLQNGRSVDIAAVTVQGNNLVIKTAADGFNAGQTIPLATADHIYGEKPAGLNAGVALLLTGKPAEALALLEPILVSQRVTASIPGNYWVEAARAALVGYAVSGNSAKCTDLGKEISDATPTPGNDPFVALGKALLLPPSTKIEDRLTALRDLTTDNLPGDICAYATYYRAQALKGAKRDTEALEAYLMIPGLFPTGSLVLTSTAEMEASQFLATLGRREEAVALLNSAVRGAPATVVATEASKRLESLK